MADPTQTNISQTTIPDYAKPYVETLLGKAEALTDINQNPYKAYPGQRTADFVKLQNDAFAAAEKLGPAWQLGTATDLAQRAGLAALNTQYGPSQYGNVYNYNPQQVSAQGLQNYQMGPAQQVGTQSFAQPGAASAYMSPYMQNVVDIQQREARRASDIAGAQQQAQAVQAGAFGGSRDAIMRAERQRNLATQLGDIQATGLQSAYKDAQAQQLAAQQQAMQGLTTGMQGYGQGIQGQTGAYGQAMQGAGTLSNIGGQQLGAQQSIANLQNVLGQQQQQNQQQVINQAMQNLQLQRMYPQQQLQYLSGLLSGLPVSSTGQVTNIPAPSLVSQLGGLGLAGAGAYGLYNKIMGNKKGGAIKAKGGNGLMDVALSKIGG